MSTYGTSHRPPEDLTARARIIDAALAEFARRGEAATMKSIAGSAGVSVGLVQHHFGTKTSLRSACDARVLALVRTKVAGDEPDGQLADPNFIAQLYVTAAPVMPYLARVALEADEQAAALFDEIAALTGEWFTARWPDRFPAGADRTRDVAAAMVSMYMGSMLMHHQLARVLELGEDPPMPSPLVGLAMLDVFQALGEFLATPFGLQLRHAVEAHYDSNARDAT